MPARRIERTVATRCEWCGVAFTAELRGKNSARRTCSTQCCIEMAAAHNPGNQVTDIPLEEIWRRAAVIRNNHLLQSQWRELQPLDW